MDHLNTFEIFFLLLLIKFSSPIVLRPFSKLKKTYPFIFIWSPAWAALEILFINFFHFRHLAASPDCLQITSSHFFLNEYSDWKIGRLLQNAFIVQNYWQISSSFLCAAEANLITTYTLAPSLWRKSATQKDLTHWFKHRIDQTESNTLN